MVMEIIEDCLLYSIENPFLYAILCLFTTLALSSNLHQLFILLGHYQLTRSHVNASSDWSNMKSGDEKTDSIGQKSDLVNTESEPTEIVLRNTPGRSIKGICFAESPNYLPDIDDLYPTDKTTSVLGIKELFKRSSIRSRLQRSKSTCADRVTKSSSIDGVNLSRDQALTNQNSYFKSSSALKPVISNQNSYLSGTGAPKPVASKSTSALRAVNNQSTNALSSAANQNSYFSSTSALHRAFVSVTHMMRQISEGAGGGENDVVNETNQSDTGSYLEGGTNDSISNQSEFDAADLLLKADLLSSEADQRKTSTKQNGNGQHRSRARTLASEKDRPICAEEYCSHCCNNRNCSNSELKTLSGLTSQLEYYEEEISKLQRQNVSLRDRLSDQANRALRLQGRGASEGQRSSCVFEDLCLGDARPTALIKRFEDLYSSERVEVLDELDQVDDLVGLDQLKQDLLSSILRASFQHATRSLLNLKENIRKLLLNPYIATVATAVDSATGQLQQHQIGEHAVDQSKKTQRRLLSSGSEEGLTEVFYAVSLFLRKHVAFQNQQRHLQQDYTLVENLLTAVLESNTSYPRKTLENHLSLLSFTQSCLALAWALAVQSPAYVLIPLKDPSPPQSLKYSPPRREEKGFRGMLRRAWGKSEECMIPGIDEEFNEDRHIRFHASNPESNRILRVVWPGLAEKGPNERTAGFVVCKVVVVT